MYFRVIFCHVLLLGMALSSPVETNPKENKLITETTTQPSAKASTPKNLSKEQVQSTNNAQTEKPATKKRDIPEILTDRSEYIDDYSIEGRPIDDYEINQALRAYLDNPRNQDSLYDTGNKYREDMMALAAYKQQQRLHNGLASRRWADINNSMDVQEAEESGDIYDDRSDNFYDRYQRYHNWGNSQRPERLVPTRRRRFSLANPKLRVPIYRRAIL